MDIQEAVEEVKNKFSILGGAATAYYVLKSTIFRFNKKDVLKQPRRWRKYVFSAELKKELGKYIGKCSQYFHGLTIQMVTKFFFKFSEQNKLKQKFDNYEKTTNYLTGKTIFIIGWLLWVCSEKYDDHPRTTRSRVLYPGRTRSVPMMKAHSEALSVNFVPIVIDFPFIITPWVYVITTLCYRNPNMLIKGSVITLMVEFSL